MGNEFSRSKFLAGLRLLVIALALFALPFGAGGIHGQDKILARLIAGIADSLQDMLNRIFIRSQIRRKTAFITNRRGLAFLFEQGLQGMEYLRRPSEPFAEGRCARRHNHEFLRVHGVRGMGAAVQNIHHRHRQMVAGKPAQETIERNILRQRSRLGRSQRHRQDGIGAQNGLIFRAIQRQHYTIHGINIGCIHPR